MNTIIKQFTLLITFLLPLLAFTQQTRFVELTVTDTLILKPLGYIYQVDIGEKNDFMGMDIMMDIEEEDLSTISIQQVTEVLEKEGYKFTLSSDKDYSISSKSNNPSVYIEIKSEKELKALIGILKKQEGVTGKLKEVKYESEDVYQEESFKRLYNKALAQVTMMAKISECNVGQLLSITDNSVTNSFNFMDYYKQMLLEMPGGMFGKLVLGNKNVEVKKTFKFELK